MPDLRYWRPWRLCIIALSEWFAWWPWAEARLLGYLYPSDTALRFKDNGEEGER